MGLRPAGQEEKPDNADQDRGIGDIEDGIIVAPKYEMEHVNDMSIDKVINNIAGSPGNDQD